MYRQIRATTGKAAPDAVAVVVFEKVTELPEGYRALDQQVGGALAAALARPEFAGGRGAVTTLYPAQQGVPARLFVLGLGPAESFTGESLRIATAKLVRAAFAAKVRRIDIRAEAGLGGKLDPVAAGRAIADGLCIANFEFDPFKGAVAAAAAAPAPAPGSAKNGGKKNGALDLDALVDPALRGGFERGLVVGESVNLARALQATPPNVANPGYLVGYCRKMARQVGLTCTVIDAKRAAELQMGGLVAVGAAGSSPPALIVLEHKPTRPTVKGAKPVLFVGKAVTFDTGGYSIKPAEAMDRMKYDKSGGMAVIGAMHAIARLDLPVHVVGLVPTAENLVSDRAYRPGDILTFCNGVTTEVTNTDAEGRIILADALAWGTREYEPQAVIDLATLTGGVVVALGTFCAGCFCGDQAFRSKLFDAADFTGERLWHLPLWEEHRTLLKGTHGDLVNSGGREAHPIQGAAFLSYFVGPDAPRKLPTLPWAHLDIAGVADMKADTPLFARGPTGYGVRLLVRTVETW